jgi:hypothetical protein
LKRPALFDRKTHAVACGVDHALQYTLQRWACLQKLTKVV